MIVVIDGYNLLRSIYPREKGNLDKQRHKLIYELGHYKKQRYGKITEIVLVFDGGEWGRATREIHAGVAVVYSGQKESADDWIIRYVNRNKDKELLLVTCDRELIKSCKHPTIEIIKVEDFYKIMQDRLLEEIASELEQQAHEHDVAVHKYKRDRDMHEIESEALDILMKSADVGEYKKDDEIKLLDMRKSAHDKASKKDKKGRSKLSKL